MPLESKNYTLGRGELRFAKFIPGTRTPNGHRYLGNSPEFTFTTDVTTVDHYDSDHGLKEKDSSVALQTNRSGGFRLDDIQFANIALMTFGDVSTFVTTAATVTAEHHDAVGKNLYYQLGATPTNPTGNRGLDSTTPAVVVNDAGSPTTYVVTTDYVIDYKRGTLYVVPTGAIVDGTNLRVTYHTAAVTRDRVLSGNTPIEGALDYAADNAAGANIDYYFPWIKITPDGDYNMKSDDWQSINFKVDIYKISETIHAVYCDGVPYAT